MSELQETSELVLPASPPATGPVASVSARESSLEERLRLALEAGEMGAWEYRVAEGRVRWSETLERIHGLEPGTFGGTFEEYKRDIHPEDRGLVFETITHTLAGAPHLLRYRIIRPDGAIRWVEARGTLIKDAEGAPQRIVGVCMDITDRKNSEIELDRQRTELEHQTAALLQLNVQLQHANDALLAERERAEVAEHRVSDILSAITDPFVVHDSEWRFQYVNDAAARVFFELREIAVEDMIGKSLWELYPDLVGTRFEREMRRAQEQRIPVTFTELYARRGTWAELRCYPLPDGGVATIWKNITEQKRAEERLDYLSQASAILASSLDYKPTVAQFAELLVPKLADWCGIRLVGDNGELQTIAAAHVDPLKAEWIQLASQKYPVADAPWGPMYVLRTGNSELFEEVNDELLREWALDDDHLRMLRKLRMTSVLRVPLKARGRAIGVLSLIASESGRRYGEPERILAEQLAERAAIAIDNARLFTDTAKARSEAEAANRSKADFLAQMSHELRTPLNAIAGYSELMELGLHGPLTPEQEEDLKRIRRSQRHLLSLINDVLNFAKLEAARVQFDLKSVAISELVASLDALIAPQVAKKKLRFDIEPIDPSLEAWVDEEKVLQILLNLLSNAVKFTEPGGLITVSAAQVENVVCIEVRDSGCGIPLSKQESVFEPFVQLERTLSSPHEGTGLGLAISRDLARGMHGELTVESSPGEGSKFTLRLPANDVESHG